MAILIASGGSYTVVPGETYIIDASVTGTVTFVPPAGAGTADFTVEVNSTNASGATINFEADSSAQTLSPTVNVGTNVDASTLDFTTNSDPNFGTLTYNLGDGSAVGILEGVDSSISDGNEVKTYVNGGQNVTVEDFTNGDSKAVITLGDDSSLLSGLDAGTGGLDFTAGDNFVYTGGPMYFDFADGDSSVTLGLNADLNGQTIAMGATGPNFAVTADDGSQLGDIYMGGGYGEKTVDLGQNVTVESILIGGSGTSGDFMQVNLNIGDGSTVGGALGTGNISIGGSNVDRTITIGDNVTVEGHLSMGGIAGTNIVTIGNNYTQNGYFTGSTSSIESVDIVTIGEEWQFNSTFSLQGGDDTLIIGGTTRDSSQIIDGGLGDDHLQFIVRPEDQAAFDTAATDAGWTQNPDGTWVTNGNSLSWRGGTFLRFETASVVCFAAGTMIDTAAGPIAVEDIEPGCYVKTLDHGLQPVRWIGCVHLGAGTLLRNPKLAPIRISAGVLGHGTPAQDLLVSPQHRVYLRSRIAERMFGSDEILVAATHLSDVDGVSIATEMRHVSYYHILFDRHEIITANGARAESLFLGPEAVKTMEPETLEELSILFPRLYSEQSDAPFEPVRPFSSGRTGRKLVHRHIKNQKAFVSATF